MKSRFAVLKRGITLHGIEATDKIWLTCCALHNFLLEEDGLEMDWDSCDPNDNSVRGEETHISGIGRGNDGAAVGMGNDDSMEEDTHRTFHEGTDDDDSNSDTEPPIQNPSAPIKVWKLTRAKFRDRLVENFDIRWTRNEVVWPSRTGLGERPSIE